MNDKQIDTKLRKKLKDEPIPWHHIKESWFPLEEATNVMAGIRRLHEAEEIRLVAGFGYVKTPPAPPERPKLTPYDKGERLEPMPWVRDGMPVEHESDDFGKVDFDNDEGHTIATVWFEKNAAGGYTMHATGFSGTGIEVVWE